MTDASKKTQVDKKIVLDYVRYIHYPIWFQKNKK